MKNIVLSSSVVIGLLLIACSTVTAQVATNPDVRIDSCPYRIIFVLDESGSISSSSGRLATVRQGASSLVAGASGGSGTTMAVVEFANNANRAIIGGTTAYQLVNGAFLGAFNTYMNGGAGASGYSPSGGTNWAAAFNLVHQINITEGVADLVIFFTDGDPTVGGNGIASANTVKADGSHIFVIGILPSSINIGNIVNISGPDRYTPGAAGSFLGYDYVLEAGFIIPQCR